MKHRNMEQKMNPSRLSVALLGVTLLAASACNKMHFPDGGTEVDSKNPPATTPAPKPGLLTRINIGGGNDGLIQLISYNQQLQPVVITHYAGNMLMGKDSVVYGSNGKLEKVLNYSANIMSPGKFLLTGNTKFEWDTKGNISRKTSYDQSTGKPEEDEQYTYDANGNLVTVTTTAGGGTNIKVIATYAYEQKNIYQETTTDGSKVISQLSVAGFDQHANYITHPLLRYLVESDVHELFSEQNSLETRKVQYVNLNNKQDSIVTVQKNTYEYNTANRPVKVAFTSSIYGTNNQQPVNSKGNIAYEYSK
ncbi:hypothetical protein [Chitinophaga qingshengii]|uniref:DUF4595 domain-containing protein n=1 Tax=Chitinophaga qingshengii TaxID=1569794 RepID=A0ABR7TXK7_9BACT|nr:hypothetical protein [Chitinophaga qingshengii]MBC9934450.1 hypothetical protein [Chitinophaga qingshengii]